MDDEFETVITDKKRLKKPQQQLPEANPKFPASDPSKVKVILVAPKDPVKKVEKKKKGPEEAAGEKPTQGETNGQKQTEEQVKQEN